MKYDKTKRSTREIEEDLPGVLPAQIVLNNLIENEYKTWIIGNVAGNVIFTVNLNNGHKVITGFTEKDIALAYVNRKEVIPNIKTTFGRRLVLVDMSILKLDMIMKNLSEVNAVFHSQQIKQSIVNNIIVNPNSIDFFVPINIPTIANYMRSTGREDDLIDGSEAVHVKYDKEIKMYVISDEEPEQIVS